ncbi:MAG TPA: sigma-54 dependent transcriptional regulator [Gemmatimonadales bacterium]|nr:sigma-54 dependent transcriptional regulator [Gemmatimonadales bacterium]
MSDSIMVVDDDADVLRAVGDYFERLGYEVFRESTGEAAVEAFPRQRPDVVVLDLRLPGMDGLQVLEELRRDDASVLLLTGHGDIATAVRAMQLGAEHFLTKPVDMPILAAAAARAVEKVRLRRHNALLVSRLAPAGGDDVLGVSKPMRDLARQLVLLAESDRTTVLITGESGSGKGWVARLLHRLSGRREAPFVDVNCAGLSATFLDSELFGHEKGAFTDAKDRKQGLFEIADHGTLFLDEIAELAPELQPKVLKAIEEKSFRRLGGTREIQVDVRLIAATNHDISDAVRRGRFREDLYYRLNVIPLHLPPLRERAREDRLALLRRLFAELRAELPDSPADFTTEVLERLLDYAWPGNIREMRNVLERALILARGAERLGAEHLPAEVGRRQAPAPAREAASLAEVERRHIERTLRRHGGNRTRAAEELGISRATLINKIKVYALDV